MMAYLQLNLNKGADYEVILGMEQFAKFRKNKHTQRRIQNKPYCLWYKDTDKNELSIRFFNYLKGRLLIFLRTFALLNVNT